MKRKEKEIPKFIKAEYIAARDRKDEKYMKKLEKAYGTKILWLLFEYENAIDMLIDESPKYGDK